MEQSLEATGALSPIQDAMILALRQRNLTRGNLLDALIRVFDDGLHELLLLGVVEITDTKDCCAEEVQMRLVDLLD